MHTLKFRLLNVFAEERLGGNPLCVFEDGRGLDDATLQALARQFNLSETTFILPSERAAARVRIFTPDFEMPFAGHPTLGTAHVVRDLAGSGADLMLEMAAGLIPVSAAGDRWTLETTLRAAVPLPGGRAAAAAALGLASADLADEPRVVDTGSRQMLAPLATAAAVARCRPDYGACVRLGEAAGMADFKLLAWHDDGATVQARFFFPQGGAVRQDPATGSACANLGGWFVARGTALPLARTLLQGADLSRPSVLGLRVEPGGRIRVSGRVVELGRGTLDL